MPAGVKAAASTLSGRSSGVSRSTQVFARAVPRARVSTMNRCPHPLPRRQQDERRPGQGVVHRPVQPELVAYHVHRAAARPAASSSRNRATKARRGRSGPRLGAEVGAEDVHPAVVAGQRLAVLGAAVLGTGVRRHVLGHPLAVVPLEQQGQAVLDRPLVEHGPEAPPGAVRAQQRRATGPAAGRSPRCRRPTNSTSRRVTGPASSPARTVLGARHVIAGPTAAPDRPRDVPTLYADATAT